MTTPSQPTDFDFLTGRWQVQHRRLTARLAGDTRWETFAGTCEQRPLMGGLANVDDNWLDLPGGGYRAVSLRSFDPASRLWSIWWLDGRQPHRIDVPVIGGFAAGVGRFEADDVFEGRPIRVRFLWSGITADACQWAQAYSADGGASWETNWVMQFQRA